MLVPKPSGGVPKLRAILQAKGVPRLARATPSMKAIPALQGQQFLEVMRTRCDVATASAIRGQDIP